MFEGEAASRARRSAPGGEKAALNERQREAVTSWNRGDVCVVAGPGSGKTRVLVERFLWLMGEKKVPVRRILAITFTEKAAASMRRKLVESFAPGSEERRAVERAYISTIHAFCSRLLRENAVEAGVDPEFRVLDEWEADFELRAAIREALDAEYFARPERVREFLRAFGSNDVPGALHSLYNALRAGGMSIGQARRAVPPAPADLEREIRAVLDEASRLPAGDWSASQRAALEEALAFEPPGFSRLNLSRLKPGSAQNQLLARVRNELAPAWRAARLYEEHERHREWFFDALARTDRLYQERKRAAAALDYADLEEKAIRLIEGAAGRFRSAFSFVLMDEFQDTNPLQARLVGLLRARGNFFAVGDINQSIYGFRHAEPAVFRDYRERTRAAGGHVVELVENYRSRPELLNAVRRIVTGAEGMEPLDLRSGRDDFPPAGRPCLEVLCVYAADGERAARLEARHVAARIRELVRSGEFAYGEVAVLLRAGAQVRLYEKVFRALGVPCEVTEGRGFYDTREIQDLVAFLRVLANPRDEIALAAVLRSPLAGVSDGTLLRLKTAHRSLIEGVEQAEELAGFRKLLERFRAAPDLTAIDRLIGRLLADTGYEAWLLEQPEGRHGAANVRKLMAVARRFQAAGATGLQEFLARVEDLRREEARESEARPPEQSADAVQVMTIHAAKGLEFPAVFVPAIGRPVRTEAGAVVCDPNTGVGLTWRNQESGAGEPDALACEIAKHLKRRQREEEQRLFYVAMTRAERLLVLSASFGGQAQLRQWVPNLRRNLGLEFGRDRVDNTPRESAAGGVRFCLLYTDQEPEVDGPAPPARTEAPPAEIIERPAIGEQSDAAVAATSVALFAQCPRKYYLSRYLGFSGAQGAAASVRESGPAGGPEPDETDPTEFGREVHALLAGILPREQAGPEALRLAANFEASEWGRRAAAAEYAAREQSFLFSLDGRLVSGQIDLWFREGGETVLVDYKTDQVAPGEASERARDYTLQLALYAMAIERMTGRPVDRAVVYFLRPAVAAEVSLDPQGARSVLERLHEAQTTLQFPLHEGPGCRRCPHFGGLCPAR